MRTTRMHHTLYRNGEPDAFFGVTDLGRKEALFEGRLSFDFFCCCLSNAREWDPYCCILKAE
jgi:hypothetical protein